MPNIVDIPAGLSAPTPPSPAECIAVKDGLAGAFSTIHHLWGINFKGTKLSARPLNGSHNNGSVFEITTQTLAASGNNIPQLWKSCISQRIDALEAAMLQVTANEPLKQYLRQYAAIKDESRILETQGMIRFVKEHDLKAHFEQKSSLLSPERIEGIKEFFSALAKSEQKIAEGTFEPADGISSLSLRIVSMEFLPVEKFFLDVEKCYPDLGTKIRQLQTHRFKSQMALRERYGLSMLESLDIMFDNLSVGRQRPSHEYITDMHPYAIRQYIQKEFIKIATEQGVIKPGDAEEIRKFERIRHSERSRQEAGVHPESYERRVQLMEGLGLDANLTEARQAAQNARELWPKKRGD